MTTVTAVAAAIGGAVVTGDGTVTLTGITHDSRAVVPGSMFACIPGANADGHDFAPAAVEAGAAALLVDRLVDVAAPQVVVADVREALGPVADAVHNHPSHQLEIVGVTGTSGKTSVTHLLDRVLDQGGRRSEVLGTLSGPRTTPEATDLQATLRAMVDRGTEAVAMEVSSHALAMHRVDGTRFRAAVFTNLGHDHLDFHHDRRSYFEAKARLFTSAFTPISIVNVDDEAGSELAARTSTEVVPYRLADARDLVVDGPTARFRWRGHEIVLRLAGTHNVMNALAAALAAEQLGLDPADIADGLCRAEAPRGRFEFVAAGQPFHVAVDYAHKPDALEAVLRAARAVAGKGRVVVVFGCGGDRDVEKRPLMGRAAVEGADVVVVTSDNPRSEDPDQIVADILAGVATDAPVLVEVDRRAAIELALSRAEPGDVVLIAGKGHETVQEIGNERLPFDDRQVAIDLLLEPA